MLRAAKFAIDNGPLSAHAKIFRDTIEFDTGSIIQALPFDWRGAAGGNYAAVIFDELHVWTLEQHRRMFDELTIPPTQTARGALDCVLRWLQQRVESFVGCMAEVTGRGAGA